MGGAVDVTTHDQIGRRGYPARAGITALNLIAPGLGLFRVGHWRAGMFFLFVPFAFLPLAEFGMGNLPITSYGRAIFALVVLIGLAAALYVVPSVLTWRESRLRLPLHVWSLWYGIVLIGIIVLSAYQLLPALIHHFYKPFYAPSESMAPTISQGDKFIVGMKRRGPFRRGDLVVFNGPGSLRVSRIAAISGDTIAIRGGVPIVNGEPAIQSPQGNATFAGYDGSHSAAMLTEHLPGERSMHRALDAGASEFDDTQEVVVPSNSLFVLGDNRDRSADSRVPPELGGVGMVSVNAVVGMPMYIYWSNDHSKIGTRLDR